MNFTEEQKAEMMRRSAERASEAGWVALLNRKAAHRGFSVDGATDVAACHQRPSGSNFLQSAASQSNNPE